MTRIVFHYSHALDSFARYASLLGEVCPLTLALVKFGAYECVNVFHVTHLKTFLSLMQDPYVLFVKR
jgi:hypothetical protein